MGMPADQGANSEGRRRDIKVKLTFVGKNERGSTTYPPEVLQQQALRESSQDRTPYSAPARGNSGKTLDFGIGELAEEFASLSMRRPPSATSGVRIVNGGAVSAQSSNVASSATRFSLKAPIPLNRLSHPSPFYIANLAPTTLNSSYGSSRTFSPTLSLTDSLNNQSTYRAKSSSSSSMSPPSPQSPISVSSSSNGSAQSTNQTLLPKRPRIVRRFEYWCRVLERRRHHPMCRYCYECFVHMCKESHRPIPGVHDRGMWHGHNMRERGLVTCPHLWSTVCSHCGATKQYAHTDDHCPLTQNKYPWGHLHPCCF